MKRLRPENLGLEAGPNADVQEVTPGTVKVHTNNVYRKLSVNNRHAAVTLTKALGLLAASQASTLPAN